MSEENQGVNASDQDLVVMCGCPSESEVMQYNKVLRGFFEKVKERRSLGILVTDARDEILFENGCTTVQEYMKANGVNIRCVHSARNPNTYVYC